MFIGLFAESEGFEPPDLLQSTVFKTAAIDHSANSPLNSGVAVVFSGANIQLFLIPANIF